MINCTEYLSANDLMDPYVGWNPTDTNEIFYLLINNQVMRAPQEIVIFSMHVSVPSKHPSKSPSIIICL